MIPHSLPRGPIQRKVLRMLLVKRAEDKPKGVLLLISTASSKLLIYKQKRGANNETICDNI